MFFPILIDSHLILSLSKGISYPTTINSAIKLIIFSSLTYDSSSNTISLQFQHSILST